MRTSSCRAPRELFHRRQRGQGLDKAGQSFSAAQCATIDNYRHASIKWKKRLQVLESRRSELPTSRGNENRYAVGPVPTKLEMQLACEKRAESLEALLGIYP